MMGPVGIIGMGRLGTALKCSLEARARVVKAVTNSQLELDQRWVDDCDVICLAVRDDQIEGLVGELLSLALNGKVVLFFSGIKPLDTLSALNENGASIGRLHPLMAFSDVAELPFPPGTHFSLGGDDQAVGVAGNWVADWAGMAHYVPESECVRYHLAAVLASNFLPLLIRIGADILAPLTPAGTALDWLKPLVERSVQQSLNPHLPHPYSGPAIRGDEGTLALHRQWLGDHRPEWLELYDLATRLIRAKSDQ